MYFKSRILTSFLREQRFYTTNAVRSVVSRYKEFPDVTTDNHFDLISQVVTPWWEIDYVEQLLKKKNWIRKVVEQIKTNKIHRSKTKIHDVLPSPVIESYRNKDEFSIRTGADGNDKTVGFFIGSPAVGKVVCVPPTKLISLKESHIHLCELFQNLIRKSPLKACHDLNDGGYWRNLVVRSNMKGEIMVFVVVHPMGGSKEDFEKTKEEVKQTFTSSGCNVTSIYLQSCPNVRCTNDEAPFEHIYGDKHIYETVHDLMFRISPDSFFQVNTEAAALLYMTALKFARLTDKTTLIDLCCGIGTVSLLASKSVRGCVGIEHISQSIKDAVFNAGYNDIHNCHFVCGRIEDNLRSVLRELDLASDIVPVINPGRAGVSNRVIRILRRHPSIDRIVYISCRADSRNSINNFVGLCSEKGDSAPFALTDVQGLDMFPQTQHCELILTFQR